MADVAAVHLAKKQRADRPSQPKGVKANVPETYREQARRVIAAFFERQGQAVRSRLGAGQPWWDSARWDSELRRDILALYQLTATQAGRSTLTQLGIDPELFDEPRTQAFLAESARISAEEMNQTTHDSVEKALEEDDEDPVAAAGHVFSTAISGRAPAAGVAIVTFAAAFGSIEAARQQAPTATKTWVVNSTNPRDLHASMNGETVGIGETFSNGLDFPGAFGPADQVAGCQCSVSITIPSP